MFFTLPCCVYANDFIEMKGYFINFGGKMYFSVCDENESIEKAFNEKAFEIGNMQDINDRIEQTLNSIGDSFLVKIKYSDDARVYNVMCYYFYCTIKLVTNCSSNNDFNIRAKSFLQIEYNSKTYDFCSIWIRNWIKSIAPTDKKNMKQIPYFLRE